MTLMPRIQTLTIWMSSMVSTTAENDKTTFDQARHAADVLDEFSASSINPNPSASGPGRPAKDTDPKPAASSSVKAIPDPKSDPEASASSDADFAAQLQKEMASIMGKIDESPEGQSQLRDVMAELNQQVASAMQPDAQGDKPAAAAGADAAFQDTIRRTMERMQASGERASAAETAESAAEGRGGGEGELLSQLLQEMARTGESGAGNEEEFSKMLLGMMEQLTHREILYEPMKELHGKFPAWMRDNEGKVKEEDMKRFKEQQRLVAEIVGRYEREGYRDEDASDQEYIVERMQKVGVSKWIAWLALTSTDASGRESAGRSRWGHERGTGPFRRSRRWMRTPMTRLVLYQRQYPPSYTLDCASIYVQQKHSMLSSMGLPKGVVSSWLHLCADRT